MRGNQPCLAEFKAAAECRSVPQQRVSRMTAIPVVNRLLCTSPDQVESLQLSVFRGLLPRPDIGPIASTVQHLPFLGVYSSLVPALSPSRKSLGDQSPNNSHDATAVHQNIPHAPATV